jgi:hypothetical protein
MDLYWFKAVIRIQGNQSLGAIEIGLRMPSRDTEQARAFAHRLGSALDDFGQHEVYSCVFLGKTSPALHPALHRRHPGSDQAGPGPRGQTLAEYLREHHADDGCIPSPPLPRGCPPWNPAPPPPEPAVNAYCVLCAQGVGFFCACLTPCASPHCKRAARTTDKLPPPDGGAEKVPARGRPRRVQEQDEAGDWWTV